MFLVSRCCQKTWLPIFLLYSFATSMDGIFCRTDASFAYYLQKFTFDESWWVIDQSNRILRPKSEAFKMQLLNLWMVARR